MYAVIEHGGKQYKVTEGDVLTIDLTEVSPDAEQIELDKVLFLGEGKDARIGTPYVDGAKVIASFDSTAQQAVIKGQKLYPMHFRRRKNSKRKIGHRQKYLQVKIERIEA
ncbi:MAG: 50S ribosomal protein L21 [Planctomycetota bacterium]|jgi:large subunit ribosomal protein L21